MADEKKPDAKPAPAEHDAFVEITWLLLSLLVLMYVLNALFAYFNSGNFSSIWKGSAAPAKTISLSSVPSLLGDSVSTSKSTPVYAEPGVNQIATEPAGSKGTLIEGPMIKDGVKYWHVHFADGTDGWVPEDALNYLELEKTPLAKVSGAKVGDPVSVSVAYAQVFTEPGVNQIAREKMDAKGTIVGGPTTKDGVKYWQVQFSDGTTGWVKESDLDYVGTKAVPLSSKPSILGDTVIAAKNNTPVYDSPNGNQIGTQKKGARATIIEGPIIKNGEKYWHVKFEDGTDGWVKEGDLEYVVSEDPFSKIIGTVKKIITFWKYFAMLLSASFVAWIVYLFKKVKELRETEAKKMYPEVVVEEKAPGNPQWERVLTHTDSPNENDWRLAILEADIMLGDLLEKLSLPGDSIGDRLKAVEKGSFKTIDNAWEAHKIRNQIAHEGIAFTLNQREAKRVIELYQSVFTEFKVI